MTPLFKKLNLSLQTVVHVLNSPASFEPELSALTSVTVHRWISGKADFAMAFVVTEKELVAASHSLAEACQGDAILWICYPKRSSKKYKCEFTRDAGWPTLAAAGFEPVRMVAIDDDWSALRFRRVEYIKSMSRSPGSAISEVGKRKASTG